MTSQSFAPDDISAKFVSENLADHAHDRVNVNPEDNNDNIESICNNTLTEEHCFEREVAGVKGISNES